MIAWLLKIIQWIRQKLAKKSNRHYLVINSDSAEHIGLKMRGLPKSGDIKYIKGGTSDDNPRHFSIHVLKVFKLNNSQKIEMGCEITDEVYYIDGKYNDLEIKRID